MQITECGMMLEGPCTPKAAEHATDKQNAYLADLGLSMRARTATGEPLKYSELNSELHRYVQMMSRQDAVIGARDPEQAEHAAGDRPVSVIASWTAGDCRS